MLVFSMIKRKINVKSGQKLEDYPHWSYNYRGTNWGRVHCTSATEITLSGHIGECWWCLTGEGRTSVASPIGLLDSHHVSYNHQFSSKFI